MTTSGTDEDLSQYDWVLYLIEPTRTYVHGLECKSWEDVKILQVNSKEGLDDFQARELIDKLSDSLPSPKPVIVLGDKFDFKLYAFKKPTPSPEQLRFEF